MEGFGGKVIAITRPQERSKTAVDIIKSHGGVPLVAPTLELQYSKTKSLMELCKRAFELDWIILTSPASLNSLFKYCKDFKKKLNIKCRVAAIGPKTAKALTNYGISTELMPNDYTAEGLLEVFKDIPLKGKKVGLPRTFSARKILPEGLKEMGAEVFLAEAYKSTLPQDKTLAHKLIEGIIQGEVDAVTFTSPLTVTNLFEIAGKKKELLLKALNDNSTMVAAIGPITQKPLNENGIKSITPPHYTVKAMLERLMEEMNR
jgi:uroporphyrinogen-III synthase